MRRPPNVEFSLMETNPRLGGSKVSNNDLVEQMYYLYINVVKARDLPAKDVSSSSSSSSSSPYVEVKLGRYKVTTHHLEKNLNPEWNQVFAFSEDRIRSSLLEATVKDKHFVKDGFMGRVLVNLNEVPRRVPPDTPVAPQWYRLEERNGNEVKGELMLAVWLGTQFDEAFSESFSSDTVNMRSKVYLSPKLWYLRVTVLEARDLPPSDKDRFVKGVLGNQSLRTKMCISKPINPMQYDDLMFVAGEPFEEPLILTVENRVAPNKDEVLGRCVVHLEHVDRRLDQRVVNTRWYNLREHAVVEGEKEEKLVDFPSINVMICLEGGYHVMDESTHYCSDLRPTAEHLWKPSIGILELGILGARNLSPMKSKDGRETTDAYCVAKYGRKWYRTRTILDNLAPKWNEHYTWEVFDPFTVITVGVFDNSLFMGGRNDSRIGKVRIRLSCLETDRIYTHMYPLLVLFSSGVKKMGEIHLAVRFRCTSMLKMMHMYTQPLLPKMHYAHPLNAGQIDSLMHQATQVVSARLSRAEPPLRKEVVEFMLDVGSHQWSLRRSKANFFRSMSVLSVLMTFNRWFNDICYWKSRITTVVVHVVFLFAVLYPRVILPGIFIYLSLFGVWYYRWRPRHPPYMDVRLSQAEVIHPDELEEEFDTFPSSCTDDLVRVRYDRLRGIAGRTQTVIGDVATQGERLQSLVNWRDPRATAIFLSFTSVSTIFLFITPFQLVVLPLGFYVLRHPRFRTRLPSVPSNFFRRLPARTEYML